MSHSPGPWTWVSQQTTLLNSADDVVLAVDCPEFIDDADKSLIAAAPDLLAALKECKRFAELALAVVDFPNEANAGNIDAGEFEKCSAAIMAADTAIAKAEFLGS